MKEILRDGFTLKKEEFLLSIVVFLYLVFSLSILSYTPKNYLFPIQSFLLIFENYITVCVYYGIKRSVWEEKLKVTGIFRDGSRFFLRVLWYKILAGIFIIFVVAFCFSMVELVKETSPLTTGIITAFTVLWLSFPVYLFLHTVFTPLIIITDDISLTKALRSSMVFVRRNLLDIMKLTLIFLPFWLFVFFFLRVYNNKGIFWHIVVFCLVSMLEVITVKTFLIFYRREK